MSKEHLLLVEQYIYNAYRDGQRTQHEIVDYGLWDSPIKLDDILNVQVITGPEVIPMHVVNFYKKKLYDIDDNEIMRAGFPDMSTNNYGNQSAHTCAKEWYRSLWDRLHPFKNESWKKNPMIIIYVLEKES